MKRLKTLVHIHTYTCTCTYIHVHVHVHVHCVHIVCILLLATQCSAGKRRFLNKPCKTEPTEGLCTNCNTNK